MRIAMIGLGAMGGPVARNLIARGFAVCGYDPRAGATEALVAAGGRAAANAREAARDADAAVCLVVDAAQVEAAVFGPDGLADGLREGAVLVQCATVAPEAVASLAERLAHRGIGLVDAPLSGGTARAADGTLVVMASGAAKAIDRVRPVLDAIGSHVVLFGERPGAGSTVKMINQLLCGVHLAALGEAIAFARRAGLEVAPLLEVYGHSAAASFMLADRGPRAVLDDPPTRSAIDIFVKDLGMVLDAGQTLRFPLPIGSAAHQLFLSLSARGGGGLDDSQLWRAYPPAR